MIVGSVFSGIGMLDYGLGLAGVEHAWFCEADPWRRDLLAKRWPGRPVYDDVRSVGAGLEQVDGIVGGFPCKGASHAGKREGFGHPETVLWREMARAIRELRPRFVVVENVAAILSLHAGAVWGEVVGDLAACGFDIEWDCFPAAAFGAPHRRDRIIAIATNPSERGCRSGERTLSAGQSDAERRDQGFAPNADGAGRPARWQPEHPEQERFRDGTDEDAAGPSADPSRDAEGRASAPARTNGERTGARDHATASHADSDVGQDSALAGGLPPKRPGLGDGRGVDVEWGQYEPAIRRWESVVGPAPEPMVRRVDARAAARVERARLSGLGDGVQAQLGFMVGRELMRRELEIA